MIFIHVTVGNSVFVCHVLISGNGCFGTCMKCDIVFRRRKTYRILYLHAARHKDIAVGFAVAEPRRDLAGKASVEELLKREVGKNGKLALLQL